MPWTLLKYGLSLRYPARRDIPAPRALKKSYDVIIIGAGGHGLASAYYLAHRHGLRSVAVLDKSYLGSGNTGRNTTVIRSNYISPEAVRFYKGGVDLFKKLSNELGYNLLYSQRGQLTLAHSEASLRTFRLRAEVNRHLGVRSEIVDLDRIRRLVPSLNLSRKARYPVRAGLWHRDGGLARHDAVAWGYARAAARLGVEIHQNTEVIGILREGDKVSGVRTRDGVVHCGHVIQAVAGASSVLAALAGFRLPIRSYPLQAMVTQPVKPFLHPLVSSAELHVYLSQSARGELVIGGGCDPYELYSTRSTLDLKEALCAGVLELFPFLGEVKLLRQWGGLADMTPDYNPIMGASPLRHYWLDAGWGTWGFKATPIAGRCMAETVVAGRAPELIQPFRLERFRTFELGNEAGATAASH